MLQWTANVFLVGAMAGVAGVLFAISVVVGLAADKKIKRAVSHGSRHCD